MGGRRNYKPFFWLVFLSVLSDLNTIIKFEITKVSLSSQIRVLGNIVLGFQGILFSMQFQKFLLVWMTNGRSRKYTKGTARSNQWALESLPGRVQS